MFVYYEFYEYLSKYIILKLTNNVKFNIKIIHIIYKRKYLFFSHIIIFLFVKFIKYEFVFLKKYIKIHCCYIGSIHLTYLFPVSYLFYII